MSKKELLGFVKQNDTEWYPTTDKAIEIIQQDIIKNDYKFRTILEPCCGDGRVSMAIKEAIKLNEDEEEDKVEIYGIETNEHLRIKAKANNVHLVASDFLNERYFMEKHSLMYLNPPFSTWKQFFTKALLEFADFGSDRRYSSDYKIAYIILPPRALEDNDFLNMLDAHDVKSIDWIDAKIEEAEKSERGFGRYSWTRNGWSSYEVLDYIDFRESDRQARVEAPLIKIRLNKDTKTSVKSESFFEFAFNQKIQRNSVQDELDKLFVGAKEKTEEYKNQDKQLLTGSDIVDMEVLRYSYKFQEVMLSIKPILEIPQETLDFLEIKILTVQEHFKQKEKNLRQESWGAIFGQLDLIKDKLTTKNREHLISSYAKDLDFTHTNIREIVISSIQYAGSVMEKQIADFYWKLVDDILKTENNYWSNEIYTKNIRNFRYQANSSKNNMMLDYRVIIQDDSKFKNSWEKIGDWTSRTLEDFRVSALLLGFKSPKWDYASGTGELSTLYSDRNHVNNPLKVKDKTNEGRIEEVYEYKDNGLKLVQYRIKGNWLNSVHVWADKDVIMTARAYKKGTMHIKLNQKFLMKLTYIALKDKNIIKNSFEFEKYMNDIKTEEGKATLSKDEIAGIKEIVTVGVNPELVFKDEVKNMPLIGM